MAYMPALLKSSTSPKWVGALNNQRVGDIGTEVLFIQWIEYLLLRHLLELSKHRFGADSQLQRSGVSPHSYGYFGKQSRSSAAF